MPGIKKIPIIDLFAGPGGLGEGFSSVKDDFGDRVFDIKLSIEKDVNAHKTLELRSFFRQFNIGEAPKEYYDLLKSKSNEDRSKKRESLFAKYPEEYKLASEEAWCAELGSSAFPKEVIDEKITNALKGNSEWVLIGGPPCQAYSLVGRSRVGGIDEKDHRVYLYKEYLRIIASHHPTVFVMENVKGLLSAKVKGQSVFKKILKDLKNPSSVFKNSKSPKYKIYSLVEKPNNFVKGFPVYQNDRDFLIKSEEYGVPQKRHRVILIGVREDVDFMPGQLQVQNKISLKSIIGDLPKIRSGISRKFIKSEFLGKKKKRYYEKIEDDNNTWLKYVKRFSKEKVFQVEFNLSDNFAPVENSEKGGEFVRCNTPYKRNPLFEWYNDDKLNGVSNHESRSHLLQDLRRYLFASLYTEKYKTFPRLRDYKKFGNELLPDHENVDSGKFTDRFRVQNPDFPATTVTSHISKDGHYFIHYDSSQCRSMTVREAARIQTFPDNYLFCGARTFQYHQVGNAVPPLLAYQIAKIVNKLLPNELITEKLKTL